MIFAQLDYDGTYDQQHHSLLEYLTSKFCNIESGLQGDSWIWVIDGDEKVAIDSFSSMKHEVKAANSNSRLIGKVLDVLQQRYSLIVHDEPEIEPHE